MKIKIITQHLLNNYGGLLQNCALQQVLKRMGNEVDTIDYLRIVNFTPFRRYLLSWAKSFVLLFIPGKRRGFIRYSYKGCRNALTNDFVSKWISTSYKCYKKNMLDCCDAVIVGSDQVWRPKYNCRIEDMFLKFAEGVPIKRIAYAASFGVDDWEFSLKQTRCCKKLAKKFDAISVREDSGVKLCNVYLGVDATWVLDPTLLLKKEDYCEVCKDVPVASEKTLVAYILDLDEPIRESCERLAKERNLTLKIFRAGLRASLTVPEWLAMFRDASYVVTDSFHGTVFSIIFEKEFKCIYNEGRGAARFESLLNLYNSGKLEKMREFSICWLKNSLES